VENRPSEQHSFHIHPIPLFLLELDNAPVDELFPGDTIRILPLSTEGERVRGPF